MGGGTKHPPKVMDHILAGTRTPAKYTIFVCLVSGKQRGPQNSNKIKGELILGKIL